MGRGLVRFSLGQLQIKPNMSTVDFDADHELDAVELEELRAAKAREAKERAAEGDAGEDGEEGILGGEVGRSFAAAAQENSGVQNRTGMLRRITEIPVSFVIERLKLKLDSSELYLDLLIFIPFLVMFVYFFTYGRDTEANFFVSQGIRSLHERTEFPMTPSKIAYFRQELAQNLRLWVELDKDYWGMGNQGDFSPWLTDSFVFGVFECWTRNRDAVLVPGAARATKGQTLLIGSARFRTIRARKDSCGVDPYLLPQNRSLFPSVCYGMGATASVEDTGPFCADSVFDVNNQPLFKYKPCSAVPGIPTVGIEGVYHCGGYMFEIPFSTSCNNALAVAGNATGNNFCSFNDQWSTRFVMSEWFAYTPYSDSWFAIKYYAEVDAAGWWRLGSTIRPFQVWTKAYISQTIFEMVFLAYVLYYWAMFFYSCIKAYRRQELLGFMLEMMNTLELANLICFLVVFGFRFSWMQMSTAAHVQFPFPDEYPKNLDAIYFLYYTQVVANSVNTILTFIKALKYVSLNSQLGVLTRTLEVCQQSIAGVLVLFMLIVVSFAVSGWALFGINMEEYMSLGNAMSASMRVLVGQANYEDMRQTNRFLAGAYFWAFIILGLFLLLNFIIAILSDSFAKISGRAFTQTMEELLFRYYQNMKAFLTPDNIKRILKGLVSGNSEPKLIRKLMAQLEERKKLLEDTILQEREIRRQSRGAEDAAYDYDPTLDDDEEVSVKMHHGDFIKWVDQETYELLSALFFDYTWDEINNDYDDFKKSNEEGDKKVMFDKVEAGVKKVVGDELTKVDQLNEVMTSLESEIKKMIETVGR